ncbi:hypothetical protein CALCODRAFT_513239 [Calocera cornea HHB12733]|uniref:Uncharacterized protein n=1 Tax=Calocera cornea HHB12733 TaxID=1353952 RepID=A0A165CBG2_9BASI|nr:hypothetical protein CALCODRAFT_513239 [Calocera cornea HHB12733]
MNGTNAPMSHIAANDLPAPSEHAYAGNAFTVIRHGLGAEKRMDLAQVADCSEKTLVSLERGLKAWKEAVDARLVKLRSERAWKRYVEGMLHGKESTTGHKSKHGPPPRWPGDEEGAGLVRDPTSPFQPRKKESGDCQLQRQNAMSPEEVRALMRRQSAAAHLRRVKASLRPRLAPLPLSPESISSASEDDVSSVSYESIQANPEEEKVPVKRRSPIARAPAPIRTRAQKRKAQDDAAAELEKAPESGRKRVRWTEPLNTRDRRENSVEDIEEVERMLGVHD